MGYFVHICGAANVLLPRSLPSFRVTFDVTELIKPTLRLASPASTGRHRRDA
jgi:hypothetical protein